MKRAPWYRIDNKAADPKVADIYILDVIAQDDWWGDGVVTAKQFVKDLQALPEDVESIRVHINSPGGDVFAAVAIANALRDQRVTKGRTVETSVEGLAASAASIVMMAGSVVRVADNALVMVHNPWTIALGNAGDMRKLADALDTIRDSIVATYRWHSKLEPKQLIRLMDDETWMDADDAIANGFATEKVEGLKAAASLRPSAVAKLQVPERFAARVAELTAAAGEDAQPEPPADPAPEPAPAEDPQPAPAPAPEPAPDPAPVGNVATADAIVGMCMAAGLKGDDVLAFVTSLMKGKPSLADAQQLVSAEKERRAAEARRQQDIRALATRFNAEALVPELIAGGMPFEPAKALVQKVKAMVDKVEIDGGLKPDADPSARAAINTREIYAQLNKLPH
jgi:ATP-dependent protease ClpP protease subunit